MNRMHLKNKRKIFMQKRLLLVFFVMIFFLILFINLTNNAFNVLLNYAESMVIKRTSIIINKASDDEALKYLENDLYTITKNNNNEIETIDYDSLAVNKFLNKITDNIESGLSSDAQLLNLNIPFGVVFNNPFFTNVGPNIPVKVQYIGSVLTNISTNVKEYGINNSLIEMVVLVEVSEKIVLPFVSKDILITNEVPFSYKIINGKIPDYYGSGLSKNSNIYSIPIE